MNKSWNFLLYLTMVSQTHYREFKQLLQIYNAECEAVTPSNNRWVSFNKAKLSQFDCVIEFLTIVHVALALHSQCAHNPTSVGLFQDLDQSFRLQHLRPTTTFYILDKVKGHRSRGQVQVAS